MVSSQTTGLASDAIRSSTGAAISDSRAARCSPIRLGASSPRTRLTKVMHTVTTTNETAVAQPADMFCLTSQDLNTPARVAAP